MYRDVNLVTLDALLPARGVRLRPLDGLRLDLASVLGAAALLANLRFELTNSLLDAAALGASILFVVRTVLGYVNTFVRYERARAEVAADATVARGADAALAHLARAAAAQRAGEALVALAALRACDAQRLSAREIDALARRLARRAGFEVFSFEEALAELGRLGIVVAGDERLVEEPLDRLRAHWADLLA